MCSMIISFLKSNIYKSMIFCFFPKIFDIFLGFVCRVDLLRAISPLCPACIFAPIQKLPACFVFRESSFENRASGGAQKFGFETGFADMSRTSSSDCRRISLCVVQECPRVLFV